MVVGVLRLLLDLYTLKFYQKLKELLNLKFINSTVHYHVFNRYFKIQVYYLYPIQILSIDIITPFYYLIANSLSRAGQDNLLILFYVSLIFMFTSLLIDGLLVLYGLWYFGARIVLRDKEMEEDTIKGGFDALLSSKKSEEIYKNSQVLEILFGSQISMYTHDNSSSINLYQNSK